MIDERLLSLTEKMLIRVQNSTGIPKYRMNHGVMQGYLVLNTVEDFWAGSKVGVVIGLLLFIFWCLPDRCPRDQEEADRKQMIISNENRADIFICICRVIVLAVMGFVVGLLCLGVDMWAVLDGFGLLISLYLSCCHTFPMTGPTLRERLKKLFRRAPRVVPARGEV